VGVAGGQNPGVSLPEGKAAMLSYNRSGRSLLDYDEAMVIYNLKQVHLLDQFTISRLTGYSRSWVCRRLALIEKLDPALQDALRMGLITNSQARAMVRLPRGNQEEVMHCITEWHLTSRTVRCWWRSTLPRAASKSSSMCWRIPWK